MKIGEKYRVSPTVSPYEKEATGSVIYIHPKGRFAVLEFAVSVGSIREAFSIEEITGNKRREA